MKIVSKKFLLLIVIGIFVLYYGVRMMWFGGALITGIRYVEPLSEKDFEFNKEHKALLSPYEINDTVYFQQLNGSDKDTFCVINFDTSKSNKSGPWVSPLSGPSYKTISLEIKQLPENRHFIKRRSIYHIRKDKYDLISIKKSPKRSNNSDSIPYYRIFFEYRGLDLSYNDEFPLQKDTIGDFLQDSIIYEIDSDRWESIRVLKDMGVEEYYEIELVGVKNKIKDQKLKKEIVDRMYWTKEFGLTIYRKKDGSLYKIVPKRSY